MAVIHGKTNLGAVFPVLVDNTGRIVISGEIELGEVTLEATFGGTPSHHNGTTTTAAVEVVFHATKKTRTIIIDNTGVTNAMEFSLDGGTLWKTLPEESSIQVPADVLSLHVRSKVAGSHTTYEIIAVVAE